VRDTTLVTGKLRFNYITLRVPRQCPLDLLAKIGWRNGRMLKSGKVKMM
jgi:hypothetical protein